MINESKIKKIFSVKITLIESFHQKTNQFVNDLNRKRFQAIK